MGVVREGVGVASIYNTNPLSSLHWSETETSYAVHMMLHTVCMRACMEVHAWVSTHVYACAFASWHKQMFHKQMIQALTHNTVLTWGGIRKYILYTYIYICIWTFLASFQNRICQQYRKGSTRGKPFVSDKAPVSTVQCKRFCKISFTATVKPDTIAC